MDFRNLRGRQDLHLYLATSEETVGRLLDAPNADLFDRHLIPKKGRRGGTREVWSIKDRALADVYKALSRRLWAFFQVALPGFPHRSVHGYVPGRSTKTNAKEHVGATSVLRADIRDFFRSITREHVVTMFGSAGLKPAAADALASIVVRDGHLPLGLHTSPGLANAVCHDLDARLAALAPRGTYTRYADDLAFSGPHLPTKQQVQQQLASCALALSERKWRLVRAGRGLYLTGLSLEDRQRPRAPRDLKRRLRQELHFAATHGLAHHIGRRGYSSVQSGINKIDGTIRYLRGIEPDLGRALHAEWTQILEKEGQSAGYTSLGAGVPRDVMFLLDESVVDGPSGRVMVLGLAIVEDPDLVRAALTDFFDDRTAYPYSGTPKEVLAREGIHWNRLTADDRTKSVERIMALPFRAFVAFAQLPNEDRDTYDQVYRRLLTRVIEGRFVLYDGCRVRVVAEENSKVKRNSLAEVVTSSYEALVAGNFRRPLSEPSHATLPKAADPALPLPDLLLGVFVDYARSVMALQTEAGQKKKQTSGAQAALRFEQIRDKIRAVFDVEAGAVYSRRRPFVPWRSKP